MARKRIKFDPSGYSILVVDDQDETLISSKLLLEREGHRVLTAVDGREALSLISDEQFELIVVDYVHAADELRGAGARDPQH